MIRVFVIAAAAFLFTCAGCDRAAPSAATTQKSVGIRVASLVPGATDLLVGMGAADHLVAVSNWDPNRPELRKLPRVGDYQTTDWEKLAELHPDVMIVFMSGQRMPPGLKERADRLNIRLVNVKTENLNDIFSAIDQLGDLVGERERASTLSKRLHAQLDAVAARVAGKQPVPTLLVRDESGFALIAGDTFIDDLLTIAGGRNVAHDFPMRYPDVDRERLVQLAPQAIFQMMPDASPQVVQRAEQTWRELSQLPAVREQRIYILSDWYVLQPGSHIGDLAEQFAEKLHPQ